MSFKGGLMTTGTGIRLHVFGRFVTLIFALIVLGTCLSVAQTSTATILGTVKDTSGALIPGVSITVKHTKSGLTRNVVSGERGGYNVYRCFPWARMRSPQPCRASSKRSGAASILWWVRKRWWI